MKFCLAVCCMLPLLLLGGCTASDAEVDHLEILKKDPIFRIDVAECEKEIQSGKRGKWINSYDTRYVYVI